ncbi:MAG: ATP-binding protein [Chitinophagaceae bacterium]|nr:MAG: ATP-binding protein [Chitinophagaceae bacterium]
MPTLTQAPPQMAAKPLFIGLQSYTEAQADKFFGRDDEIDRLTNLVKANTLTIVFGKSGTGKTSLLNAGVFPRLRKDYCLPFRIRLEFQDDSPDLVTQIKNILKEEIDKYGFAVESYPSDEPLWEYFHREQLWKSVTPILIFDQFEEIFTLAKRSHFGTKELTEFWDELADLIENSIPEKLKDKFLNEKENVGFNYKVQKIKILFSFREEFLPEFESITAKIPSIKYSRFRLMPMNGDQAYEVITKTWKSNINATQAHKIVGFFSNDEEKESAYDVMEIEPSLLSQVCSFIDKERLQQGREDISAQFLNKYPKEIILSSIYNEVMDESNAAMVGLVGVTATGLRSEKPVNEFVEDKLITDEGYRTKYVVNSQDEKIRPGIEVLKAKYFVRDDGKSIELTHDVLTPLIKEDRENRRKGQAMALAKKKANRRALYIVVGALLAAGLVLYFTNQEAEKVTQKAQEDKERIQQQIAQKRDTLLDLNKEIVQSQAKLDTIQNKLGNKKDSSTGQPNDSSSTALQMRVQADSAMMDSLRSLHTALVKEKNALEKKVAEKDTQIIVYTNYQKESAAALTTNKKQIDDLKKEIAVLTSRLAVKQHDYEVQIDRYDDFIRQVTQREIVVEDTTSDLAYDTSSVHVELSYGPTQNAKTPVQRNLKIYLIPDNAANKNVIRKARVYEMYCDEMNLGNAKGEKVARYKGGVYKFYDVPPGKYFVKICAYYGGFYSFTKSPGKNDKLKFDASPPVQ